MKTNLQKKEKKSRKCHSVLGSWRGRAQQAEDAQLKDSHDRNEKRSISRKEDSS